MALTNPWWILVAAAVAILAIAAGLLWPRRPREGAGALVARAERIRGMASVRRAARIRAIGLGAVCGLGALAVLAGGVIAAKPMSVQQVTPENHSRDVMLCLDVSGSMSDVDIEILDVFDELLDGFQGERIGLTIFNASPVQVFPLTDDYGFVRTHIQSLRESIDWGTSSGEIPEHWVGTLDGPGSSLIGDGLAACALRFDRAGEDRSRSIILATDNELEGAAIMSLEQSADYAARNDIRVFALNPIQDASAVSDDLVRAAEATGGQAYALRGETTVGDIVAEVEKQDAAAIEQHDRVVWTDAPAPWIAGLCAAVAALLIVLWTVRA
ncbi:hypothetical protein GCM10010910_16840 [Microbacterium nanhaiense]|uniref:VWFA domain-containing protein n=1 Tax=Microbacterium nanhaiense TaxID=1301026 RepID=A0ABQ2N0B0_9MICO|nr:VWA domain-containing protein [Microbacterium nanhaiense]GGO63691.1 hypothetical protein GCM10010910_16840 [Microbacterium nanhaiense]